MSSADHIKMEPAWKAALLDQFDAPYMQQLRSFLVDEIKAGQTIYPPGPQYFEAYNVTPLDNVKVVILGQDPYHGPGQAHGMCFSVQPGVRIPPSLLNIYKELEDDLGIQRAKHGYLQHWAKQGVLLLNSVLTVRHKSAGSHQGRGWERFTDRTIQILNAQKQGLVYILWGKYAQEKARVVDPRQNLILKSVHPSPMAAHRGFFGSKPFSKCNQYLEAQGKTPIDWQLPEHV